MQLTPRWRPRRCLVTQPKPLLLLTLLWLLSAEFRACRSMSAAAARHKYSPRIVHTKYGPLQGVLVAKLQVEAFLGVPYATPPLESLRFMPPVVPSLWSSVRMADAYSPVCPQKLPDIANRTEALLQIPRGRLLYLEKLLPLLANQSEDCLYLNIYVPKTSISSNNVGLIPAILYIHGESYEWNAGNPYDGSILASHGNIIVVTINYRLGILGFLKTGNSNSTQGNYGLMDIIAGLHWLRENLSSFGGDPDRITVMGHSTGAALANFIAASPVTRELLHRVILISGSGLSPWALQRDPLMIKRKVAEQTSCHGDLLLEDMAPCLRLKKLSELLQVHVDAPRFLPGFAPFVDGTVLPAAVTDSVVVPDILSLARTKKGRGFELSDFPERDLLFGTTSLESYADFCAQDLEFGFGESKRDRVLRTFVRNCYYFHLNEIFSTLKNEYTDWEKPVQSPLSIRDSTLDVLSDGHTVSCLLKVGYLHSIRGGRTFFFHFSQQLNDKEFPQKFGSIRGDDVPFVLGFPLLGSSHFFDKNFSVGDIQLCKQFIRYISNFARKGDPNGFAAAYDEKDAANSDFPYWDTYDSVNQLYLELGSKSSIKSHYRGHKISIWLNLIPQLHQPGLGVFNMQHHHFQEDSVQYYDGPVRIQNHRPTGLQSSTSPPLWSPSPTSPPAPPSTTAKRPKVPKELTTSLTTECANVSINLGPVRTPSEPNPHEPGERPGGAGANGTTSGYEDDFGTLWQILTNPYYQDYAVALIITIGISCLLLLLNFLVFACLYRQRGSTADSTSKKKRRPHTSDSPVQHHLIEGKFLDPMPIRYGESSTTFVDCDISLKEFETTAQILNTKSTSTECSPTIAQPSSEILYEQDSSDNTEDQSPCLMVSPSIPEPPPPPRTLPPSNCYQGIRKIQPSQQQVLASTKKRVQIQEISV